MARSASAKTSVTSLVVTLDDVLDWMRREASPTAREGMARFGLPCERAFGISVGRLRQHAKTLGRSRVLANALWDSGWYEARLLAIFVDDPAQVTVAQMDRWSSEFDNWAVCDTACFALFDHAPQAWGRLLPWSRREAEFGKRAAFALLWALSVHDKRADDQRFIEALALVEAAAIDPRNYVRTSVNMALRAVGKRNDALHAAALDMARRLAGSDDATARWVGKDALKELGGAAVSQRLAAKREKS